MTNEARPRLALEAWGPTEVVGLGGIADILTHAEPVIVFTINNEEMQQVEQ